jgi:hypothetical protein
MATGQKNTQHHPDVQRDFETGTVNPGPGMAGPLDKKDNPSGNEASGDNMKGQADQGQQQNQAAKKDQGSCGSCGCG